MVEHDLTRKDFLDLFKAIFSRDFPKTIALSPKSAEAVRDRMIHGKDPSTKELWGAVLKGTDGFSGYGKLRGVTSNKGKPTLEKAVTVLALKGVGLLRPKS